MIVLYSCESGIQMRVFHYRRRKFMSICRQLAARVRYSPNPRIILFLSHGSTIKWLVENPEWPKRKGLQNLVEKRQPPNPVSVWPYIVVQPLM